MIVENNTSKQKHLEELRRKLNKQGYPIQIIQGGIEKALKKPQAELRQ